MLHKICPASHLGAIARHHRPKSMQSSSNMAEGMLTLVMAQLMDRSETSLVSVPANHPLLSLPSLDAEAQGLLDRLLSILPEETR